MTKFLNSDLSRTIVSVVGALLLSTTFVAAAVAPAPASANVAASHAAPARS